jgi:hypothetical protein
MVNEVRLGYTRANSGAVTVDPAGLLGRDGNDPVVRKAWEYLLRTQTADGSWQVPQNLINSRPRGLNVYPYWGTAWCAIGLLQTLPAESPR